MLTSRASQRALLRGSLFCLFVLTGCATPGPTTNADRVIVIAGASSGFGKGVALELAEQRATLVLAARRTSLIEQLARECERRGARAVAITADVSDERDVERLAVEAVREFGRIDVWVNMAGVGALGRFEEIPLEDHLRLIDVNLKGVVIGSYYAMRQFRRQQAGTLINIGSVTGRIALPYYPSYSASKHAVVGLGIALNEELRLNGDDNIHVSTINPYSADTPFFVHTANYTGHQPWMYFMDSADKVVDAIVAATLKPRREIQVGYKAKTAVTSHRIARRLTERLTAGLTHRALYEEAPPAEHTAGALHEPVATGVGVDGGIDERVEERKRLAEAEAAAAEQSQQQ